MPLSESRIAAPSGAVPTKRLRTAALLGALLLLTASALAHPPLPRTVRPFSLPQPVTPTPAAATDLPDAPSALLSPAVAPTVPDPALYSSSLEDNLWTTPFDAYQNPQEVHGPCPVDDNIERDIHCNPIPLSRQQPHRILGFMPNFRSVSAGAVAHPPGWKYNFKVATRQSFDYSSFIFLGITSLTAEGMNSHPVLGKGVHGAWSYTWRGFLDKTDGSYEAAWFMPSLLHEDTRYYPLGEGHNPIVRALYVISRQGVARTYGGHQTPNIAGLGAKVLTQIVSRTYYPTGATSFSVLATKFGYSAMRDVAFTSIREFYPDIAAHYVRKHRAKLAAAAAAASKQSTSPDTQAPTPAPPPQH